MTSDDERIAHLAGEGSGALDAGERAALDELTALLSDPAVWETLPEGLEEQVVAAIGEEVRRASERDPDQPGVVALERARERRVWRRVAAAATAVAAVAVLVVGGNVLLRDGAGRGPRFQVALAAGAPAPSGSATLTRTPAGWEVVLDVEGLGRLERGQYYQAWLRDDDGTAVALGTFNEEGRIRLWSGVSPADYPELIVTVEAAGRDPRPSGEPVLAGTVDTSRSR